MKKNETKHYVEYLNPDPNWLKKITIEVDKLLINREQINFFIIMYKKWSKDDGSTSSSQTLIVPRLPRFDKLALLQLQLYIEAQLFLPSWLLCQGQILRQQKSCAYPMQLPSAQFPPQGQ